jgi:hypothetical protein
MSGVHKVSVARAPEFTARLNEAVTRARIE